MKELEIKIHNTVSMHADFWKETGALEFALSVNHNSNISRLVERPHKYGKLNNKSILDEGVWGNDVMENLRKEKLVRDVN